MLDILFTIVILLLFILCFTLYRKCRKLQRQIYQNTESLMYLFDKLELSADADGADDRSE